MDGGLTAALAIGAMAASAGAAGAQANAQNKATRRSMASAARGRDVLIEQTADAVQLEKLKRMNQMAAIRARLAVTAIERGVGTGGSVAALHANEAYNAELDASIIDSNQRNTLGRIESETEAQFAALAGRTVSPLLAAFNGGLNGLAAGLNIGGTITEAYRRSGSGTDGREGT
jgi:hypothetical protein